MQVINLNSSFDWTATCMRIAEQTAVALCSVDMGLNDSTWHVIASKRLSDLKWLFLVDEQCMKAQDEECPCGEDTGESGNSNAAAPFCCRQGGKNQEGSSLNRRPLQLTGGGVVEPLGVYVPRARTFAKGAFRLPEWQRKRSASAGGESAEDTLAALLPPSVSDEPAIFICPERLFRLPGEMANAMRAGEPHPDPDRNWTELLLRMTILHEIGHHLLPAPSGAAAVVSEALANWFCASCLSEDERQWLFAKGWLLQPSVYLAWYIPRLWEKAGLTALHHLWSMAIRSSLGISASAVGSAGGALIDERWAESSLERSGVPMSPQVRNAFTAMVQALSGSRHGMHMRMEFDMMLRHATVCDWGPFEEYAMLWRDAYALLPLLCDGRPTVAAAAFRLLDGKHYTDSLNMGAQLDAACDRFLASENALLAGEAWHSERARRKDGFEMRFLAILDSPHTDIAVGMLSSAFRSFVPADRQEKVLREVIASDRITTVRVSAARVLAEVLCEAQRSSRKDWEWLSDEKNYLVYAAGAERILKEASGEYPIPVEVAYAAIQPLQKTIEHETEEQRLEYDEQVKLRERLDAKQWELLRGALDALLRTGVECDDWLRDFKSGLYAAIRKYLPTAPKATERLIEKLPVGACSFMLLNSCGDRDWKLTAMLLDSGANLDWYRTTRNSPGKSNRERNAFHIALAAYDVPASIVARMAEIPDALETKDSEGNLPIEIAIDNRHGNALVGLLALPEATTKRLLRGVVRNNCSKGLEVLMKEWRLSDDERRDLHSIAMTAGSRNCAEILCSGDAVVSP